MTFNTRPLLLTVSLLALFSLPAMAQRSSVSGDYAAMLETRIQSLEEQLSRMTGQIEQSQYQARSAQERVQRLEEDMNTRFRMLEDSRASTDTTDVAPATDDSFLGNNARAADTAATLNASQNDTSRLGELTSGSTDPVGSPADAYDQAFKLIRDNDYDAAEVAMRNFLTRWPKHELSSNASYWLGETFYVRGDYKTAAKSFAETYQKYPQGSKAEDTLLKLGLSLAALKRTADACTAFDQLDSEFPNMSPTTRRRMEQEREQLACGGNNGAAVAPAARTGSVRRN